MLFPTIEAGLPRVFEIPDEISKASALRASADSIERKLTANGSSALTNDELISIVAAEKSAGRPMSLYLSSDVQSASAALQSDIVARQRRLPAYEEAKTFALLQLDGVHMVAAHARITQNSAAVAVVDSSDSPLMNHDAKEQIGRRAGNSLHWILCATQKDGSSCAAFAIAALRTIHRHSKYFDTYLRNMRPSSGTGVDAGCTMVQGRDVLPPSFYSYAQSRRTVDEYCETSRFVKANSKIGTELLAYHDRHRRTLLVGSNMRESNIAIFELQARLLREAAEYEERAEADASVARSRSLGLC